MDNFRDFIFNKCVDFSIRITKLFTYLTQEKHEFVISKQILRSGTSIGANLAEAQYGISRKDFHPNAIFLSRRQPKQCTGLLFSVGKNF